MTKDDTNGIQAKDIVEAIGLLTRLPVQSDGERGIRAAWAWPLAGVAVAFMAWAISCLAMMLGLPTQIAAGLAVITLIIATGAMHEDGLADCADGFWGGYDPKRRLEIMKDSQIGTYGVLALIASIGLRWQALALLFWDGIHFGPLIAAAALSRVPMVALMAFTDPARNDGLSVNVGRPSPEVVAMAAICALIPALIFTGFAAILCLIALAASYFLLQTLAKSKLGGQTGDVLGASQQVAETLCLFVFLAVLT